MKPAKLQPSEVQIQKAICEYLTFRGIFHWRTNTGAMLYEYKGKKRFVRYGFPGVADIIGILPTLYYEVSADVSNGLKPGAMPTYSGRFLAIEVKRPGGKLTLDQQAFRTAVKENGGLYILATSLEDVQRALDRSDD